MFVTPKQGLMIFDPRLKDRLPPEGREVPDGDVYWTRLLLDGDIVLASEPAGNTKKRGEKK